MKETNLCYLLRPGQVLLAMKKRGFGVGKWNGPGGKALPGESRFDAVKREVAEEIGVEIRTVEPRGVLEFIHDGHPDMMSRCWIYACSDFTGSPVESEEMRPQWFVPDAVPYHEMWESDRAWFPQLLAGKSVSYKLYFDKDIRFIGHEPLVL